MVLFNDVARVGFPLTTYATNFDVTTAILGMNFNGGISNIAAGMHTAMTEVISILFLFGCWLKTFSRK